MLNEAHPTSHKEVLEIVRWANSEQQPLHLFSHKTKETLGGLVKAENSICLTSVSGIELYEPDELVITVKAGTPVLEIESALAENNQHLIDSEHIGLGI